MTEGFLVFFILASVRQGTILSPLLGYLPCILMDLWYS